MMKKALHTNQVCNKVKEGQDEPMASILREMQSALAMIPGLLNI